MNTASSRINTPIEDESLSAHMQLAAQLCPSPLCITQHRIVVWCNDKMAAGFGYTAADLIGQSLAMLYPSMLEFEHTGERGEPLMRMQNGEYFDERIMRLADGSMKWFRVSGQAQDSSQPFAQACWVFEPMADRPIDTEVGALTTREREVLMGLMNGHSAKVSARQLGISHRTVEKYRAQLMRRFDVHNVTALLHKVSGLP